MAKKKNKYNGIQRFLRSQRGQTLLNYAYSWGASVVIAGALFKLTHMDGADIMLFLGMGTEVLVFFLAGFEPQEAIDDYGEVIPDAELRGSGISEETAAALANAAANAATGPVIVGGGVPADGPIVVGGGGAGISEETAAALANAAANLGGAQGEGTTSVIEPMPVTIAGASEPTPVTVVNAAELAENISSAPAFTSAQFRGMTPEMQEATKEYVAQLQELTEVLRQVAEQSARLTRDSEEMETMNRTLTGINRFYELQLKSVGTQSATIDDVNEQTKKLAGQLQELNEVYAKMVEALKMKIA